MQIYINNKLAALKEGTSFEYVSENRLFSGSDGYSLTITFPLRDCPQNQAIFGHINRMDVSALNVIFQCEIQDRNFYKYGCITITEINEAEVKTQFLDGRSAQNFEKTLDKIYINEMNLGKPSITSKSNMTTTQAWGGHAIGMNAVALPWVNDASGNIQNKANYANGLYSWDSETAGLSWQPYLIYITKRICEQIGYSYDFSAWEAKEEYKYLLICNTLPYSWYMPSYADAMPHWTIEEFFAKLEMFMGCEFNFDHRAKSVSFAFTKDILNAKSTVVLDEVIAEHSTEVKVENDKCEYIEAKNLVYKDCNHNMWKFYSCDWFVKSWKDSAVKYATLNELLSDNKSNAVWNGSSHRGSNMNKVLYAADCDCYFVIRAVSRTLKGTNVFGHNVYEYQCVLQPINLLGGHIVDDSDDATQEELEFVPAQIDFTDSTYGRCLFLSFSGYDESEGTNIGVDRDSDYFYNSVTVYSLEAGEKEKEAEYYDRIYIGWWDGAITSNGKLPYPGVENIEILDDWSNYSFKHFSLRLNDATLNKTRIGYDINPKQKTTFKFIADSIPDVRSLFIIRGKRYVCEKLTATFTERGMSQLVNGFFYPIND